MNFRNTFVTIIMWIPYLQIIENGITTPIVNNITHYRLSHNCCCSCLWDSSCFSGMPGTKRKKYYYFIGNDDDFPNCSNILKSEWNHQNNPIKQLVGVNWKSFTPWSVRIPCLAVNRMILKLFFLCQSTFIPMWNEFWTLILWWYSFF